MSATWGTIKLFHAKASAEVDEDGWTFGQVLPAVLLAAPILVIVKTFADHWKPPSVECEGLLSDDDDTRISMISVPPPPNSPDISLPEDGVPEYGLPQNEHFMGQERLLTKWLSRTNCYFRRPARFHTRMILTQICLHILLMTGKLLYDITWHADDSTTGLLVSNAVALLFIIPSASYMQTTIAKVDVHNFHSSRAFRWGAHLVIGSATTAILILWIFRSTESLGEGDREPLTRLTAIVLYVLGGFLIASFLLLLMWD